MRTVLICRIKAYLARILFVDDRDRMELMNKKVERKRPSDRFDPSGDSIFPWGSAT